MIGLLVAAGAVSGTPITGGTSSSDAAIVALAHGDVLTCTATVIAPHAVLTAAHCLSDTELPDVVEGGAVFGGVHHAALAAFRHPLFDAVTLANDLAVVIVDPPLVEAPLPYAAVLELAPGAAVRVVGYGWTVVNDTTPAVRRTGTARVATIDELFVDTMPDPSQACEGDSGGPALFDAGGGEHVIGVTSSGDATCTQVVHYTRVDIHADWIAGIVAKTAAGGAGAGDRCWYDDNCADGVACVPALDEPRLSFCTPACVAGSCPDGLTCIASECRHDAPSPGATGAPCELAGDCVDDRCTAPAGGTDAVCTRPCFSDLPGFACPAGTTCSASEDGTEACFVPASSGCTAIGGGGLLLVLAPLALIPRRRSTRRAAGARRVPVAR